MTVPSLLFERFELQPAQRRLLRDGEVVALRARAFDLLLVLAERAGDLVTKSELLDLVWPGVVVEENNIAAQIAALRKVLGGECIATVPGRGYCFTARLLPSPGRTPAETTEPAEPTASPRAAAAPATPTGTDRSSTPRLFGRDDDLRTLQAQLREGGCVTLVGAGGVGKTVLAQAATRSADGPGRVWVDLAALGDAAQLPGALRRALGMASPASASDSDEPLASAVAAALAQDGRCLVLDNAEHLADATAALVASLLQAAPGLPVLVTSQLPLRIAGERVQPLEPLALPPSEASDDATAGSASVQLLVERIHAADARFPLPPTALPLLRQLCTRLDGLPLALEMAGAMVPLLGLQGVLAALDQRFAALTRGQRNAPPRHRTLHAAMAWSHGLLAPAQQRVFRRLGVFANGFSLELAVAVAGDDGEDRWTVIDALSELLERSLVASLHADPPRYRLLETMRSFALDQLTEHGEAAAVRLRAVQALTTRMRPATPGGPDAVAATELANVPELLAWARREAPPAAVALTLAANKVATWTPWLGEAGEWVAACEALLDETIPLAQQAEWWRDLARFESFVRGPRTVEAARRACALERVLDNPSGLFWSLIPLLRSRMLAPDEFEAARREAQALLDAHPDWPPRNRVTFSGSLAMEYRRRGDFESAWRHQQDEAELAERAGLHQIADNAQSNLAATLVGLGRYAEALARTQALLARSGDTPSPIGAHNRVQQLSALIGLHRLDEAQALAAEALPWSRRYEVLDIFQVLALLAALQGRAEVAATLLGYHRQCLAQRGAEVPADSHAPWRDALRIARETLGEARLQGLMDSGARLDAAAADRLLFEPASTSLSAHGT